MQIAVALYYNILYNVSSVKKNELRRVGMSSREAIDEQALNSFLLNKKNGITPIYMEKPILITFNVELGLREALRAMAYSKRMKLSELLREICEEVVIKLFDQVSKD